MNATENYNSREEEPSERQLRRQRRYRLDTAFNWIFLSLVALIGYWVVETDIDTYQSEKLFLRMLNDGVSVQEASDPFYQRGMERNMSFKGQSESEFFVAKWKWRIPVYVVCFLVPIIVGFARVRSKDRRRWNWAYFPSIVLSLGYGIYFWGRWTNKW